MPNLFEYLGYKVYFWSNEKYEPIHVHISKGKPGNSSAKIWLTKNGRCVVANNNANIPQKTLRYLIRSIEANYLYIVAEWKDFYETTDIQFYC